MRSTARFASSSCSTEAARSLSSARPYSVASIVSWVPVRVIFSTLLVCRDAARVTAGEALILDPERAVEPRPLVLQRDLVGQRHELLVSQQLLQLADLLVGDADGRVGDRVGVRERLALKVGEQR